MINDLINVQVYYKNNDYDDKTTKSHEMRS